MNITILPCFSPGRHEAEGIIIGHMLAGYGELELEMAACVGAAIKNIDESLRAMFSVRGEDRRIKLARANLKLPAAAAKLEALTERILTDMDWCKTIRNQYAHCQWYPTTNDGLGFVNFEDVALIVGPIGELEKYRTRLDLALLTEQEDFFVYTRCCFWHLTEQFKNWAEGSSSQTFPLPPVVAQPLSHI